MTEPLLKVTNLRQHFKISRSFTVKAVNGRLTAYVKDGEFVLQIII